MQLVPEYIVIVGVLGLARSLLFPTAGPEFGDSLPSAVMVGRAFPWRLLIVLAMATAGLGVVTGEIAVLLQL